MKTNRGTGLILLAAVFLGGCQGPETRVLPRQNVSQEQPYELTATETVLEEVNPFYQQEALNFLSMAPRVCGSAEETNAAEYIKRLLIEYGYDVMTQRFPVQFDEEDHYGTNVIAVKKGSDSEGDILLVTTSHDTTAGSPGANDNASGVAVFLETARLIARMPADTELRFISFSGTAHKQQGIRHYMERLTEKERSRIVGAIHLDTLGYLYDDELVLGTIDGLPTLLGDLLLETLALEEQGTIPYRMDDSGGYTVFDRYRIPAVRITQRMTAFEQGTPQDRPDMVDVDKLADISRLLSQLLTAVMQEETPPYLKASQAGDYYRDGALIQRLDRGIPFGEAREQIEYYYGSTGTFLESADIEGQLYQYPMKWLQVDQVILSDFLYRDGVLTSIILEAEAAGIETLEMQQRLTHLYGEPEGEAEMAESLFWHDLAGNIVYRMEIREDGYEVTAEPGIAEETELARYVTGETLNALPVRCQAAIELAEQILRPEEGKRISAIVLFTDGIGNQQVYWSTSGEGEEEELYLHIDVEDMTDSDGDYRNRNESIKQLVYAYADFYQEDYGGLFYETFDHTNTDEFAAVFRTFVLTNQPASDRLEADERTLFFYQFEPLVTMRDDIRRQLGLPV